MIGSILVKMPEITKNYSKLFGVKIINKYFVRLKGDIYIPLFNLPLLHPEIFSREDGYKAESKLTSITYKYYEKYLELRKQKQFNVKVFLPEEYGGNALYYLLQKFMIGEATPKEIEIVSEFLSKYIFNRGNIDMLKLLSQYYDSICGLLNPESEYISYKKTIFINTPVGNTPLYVSEDFFDSSGLILTTKFYNYRHVAFLNVLTSYFFGESIQIGSTRFNLLKSFGELDLNWNNVKVISFRELYDISDAIIENNLKMTYPRTLLWVYANKRRSKSVSPSYLPILRVVGNAINFKNKSVMFLFAMLKRKKGYIDLSEYNNTVYLNKKKDVEYFVVNVPFKNIKKFIIGGYYVSGIFIIEQDGKTIPVLSTDVGLNWIGVGRENIVIDEDYGRWYNLLRKLASPEHLKKLKKKL